MAVLRESRRARGRGSRGPAMASGGLGAARLAVRGGLLGRRLRAGLTVGVALAAGQELDALGDHVDPRGVVAVLGAVLLKEQPAVDRDLPAGLEVLRARRGLRVEALDVEVAVLALLAGALDGEAQRADRGPRRGLEELRVLGEVPGAGPAIHRVLLRPLGAVRVADKAATGANSRDRAHRRAAVRPSPSEASGLRAVPQAPTMQPQPATRAARQAQSDTDTPAAPACPWPDCSELDRAGLVLD